MKVPTIKWEERDIGLSLKELCRSLSNSTAVMYALLHWQEDVMMKINRAYDEEIRE